VEHLVARGEKVGLLKVRLFRPLAGESLVQALPPTVRSLAVLDRTKEPGADGEPLYKDVVTAITEDYGAGTRRFGELPRLIGGRFGLSSKEFTPGMVKAVFDELTQDRPKNRFTVGIIDDVSHSSLSWDPAFRSEASRSATCAVFFGLGADGTVSANKNAIKIIGEKTKLHAQGYFVYDSKKAGAVTVSHLRFGPDAIRSTYLIGDEEANFVACHQSVFLERYDLLDKAAPGAVFLLNTSAGADGVWDSLPRRMQRQLIDRRLSFYVIDAYALSGEMGLGRRINTIMQACFFAISDILPGEEAIAAIKDAARETYARAGPRIVEANLRVIDAALAHLHQVEVPTEATSTFEKRPPVPAEAPEFVRRFTGELIAGRGDAVPVSLLPVDGTFPVGTAAWEKRNLALEIPVWESDICTQCGKCVFVCPHSVIRSNLFPADAAEKAPASFKHVPVRGKAYGPGLHISYQVSPEDCTGCALCVEVCPIRDRKNAERKALNMAPQPSLRAQERENWDFFLGLPPHDRRQLRHKTLPGAMHLEPLFEFSGACEGCGETPYLRLASQLFGDRMVVANATGCSSIYGGNLPTTPWTTNREGRGPAWSNSLFEDNAEFGLGMRVAIDKQMAYARELVDGLRSEIGEELAASLLEADQSDEAGIAAQRQRVAALQGRLAEMDLAQGRELQAVADTLIRRSVWIVGGDGWAYDIGFGGLDHVLAAGRDVNLLVLDTEVYSNTGGQTSKATPRGAVAKFSAGGKTTPKKDLARMAMDYEHVYVAQVAFGAKDTQTLHAFQEADSYPGPSLIIAYSPCIAHGVDLSNNLRQQQLAVHSGHWPLFRYDPRRAEGGRNPLHLDSKRPTVPFRDFAVTEARFSVLWRTHPDDAEQFLKQTERDIMARYRHYEQLAALPVGEVEDAGEDETP